MFFCLFFLVLVALFYRRKTDGFISTVGSKRECLSCYLKNTDVRIPVISVTRWFCETHRVCHWFVSRTKRQKKTDAKHIVLFLSYEYSVIPFQFLLILEQRPGETLRLRRFSGAVTLWSLRGINPTTVGIRSHLYVAYGKCYNLAFALFAEIYQKIVTETWIFNVIRVL